MTTVRIAWEELGARLEALGLKLKLHYEQSRDGEVTETIDRLRAGVQDAFDAAGHAMKDEAVRADVREAGRLLAEALATTMEKVGEDLRDAAARKT
jgi:hypothetical protein